MAKPVERRKTGPQKGVPYGPRATTLAANASKEAAREFVRQFVSERLQPLLESQIANAQGLKYLVLRDKKTGKFTRVGKDQLEKLLDGGDEEATEQLEVWEKDPSVQAFTDLLNRALDKPKEQEQELKVTGSVDIITARMKAARARLAKS